MLSKIKNIVKNTGVAVFRSASVQLLGSDLCVELILSITETLVKRTDNKLDDEVLAVVRKVLTEKDGSNVTK